MTWASSRRIRDLPLARRVKDSASERVTSKYTAPGHKLRFFGHNNRGLVTPSLRWMLDARRRERFGANAQPVS